MGLQTIIQMIRPAVMGDNRDGQQRVGDEIGSQLKNPLRIRGITRCEHGCRIEQQGHRIRNEDKPRWKPQLRLQIEHRAGRIRVCDRHVEWY